MRRMLVLGTVVLAGLTAVGVSAQRATLPGITDIEQVGENLYRIGGAGGNTVVYVREDGVALIDTKLPQNGQSILDQVRKVTDKPVTMIINTHSHPDHLGSNTEIEGKFDAVQIVAQRNSANRMAELPNVRVPDQSFDDRLTLGSGDDRIELYWFGPGHTDGDAFVVFPGARAMAAGDIYAWHMSPLIDPGSGGSILQLPVSLTQAVSTIKGVDTVVTGHGEARTWDDFRSYTIFHRGLVETAKSTLARDGTPEDALASLEAIPSYWIFLGDELMPGLEYGGTPKSRALINLNVAFQELRGEPVTTNWGPPRPAGGGAPPADEGHAH